MLKTRHREKLLFQACVEGKATMVIDNTNASREERNRYLPTLRDAGYRVVGFFFQSRIEECLERNRARDVGIPDGALRGASSRLEIPALDEGFDELFFVKLSNGEFIVDEWTP